MMVDGIMIIRIIIWVRIAERDAKAYRRSMMIPMSIAERSYGKNRIFRIVIIDDDRLFRYRFIDDSRFANDRILRGDDNGICPFFNDDYLITLCAAGIAPVISIGSKFGIAAPEGQGNYRKKYQFMHIRDASNLINYKNDRYGKMIREV